MKTTEQITLTIPIGLTARARAMGINTSRVASNAIGATVAALEKAKIQK